MATKSFTVASVPGSGSKVFNETSFIDWALITSVKVSIQSGGSGGSYQFQLHRKDTHLDTDLVYNTEAVTGTYRDPVQDDDGTITTDDNHQGFLTPYEDVDASQELHGKIINNDAAIRSFDVVIEYLPLVPGGLTAGSVLFTVANGGVGQDNANLFWDDSNNRLGLGTTAPTNLLHVSRNGASGVRFTSNDFNQLLLEDGDQADASTPFHFIGSIGGNFTIGSANRSGTGTTGSQTRIRLDSGGRVGIGTTSPPTGGGTPLLVLAQAGSDPSGIGSNTAGLIVKDVAGTAELFAFDEAGNVPQLSPHDPETGEYYFNSTNLYTGRVLRVWIERAVRKLEEMTGESFIEEDFLPENERQDWDANQAEQVARRQAEIDAWSPDSGIPKPKPLQAKPNPHH